MKKLLIRSLIVCAFALSLSIVANAQNSAVAKSDTDSAVRSVLTGAGNATFVIVGSAGKVAWSATKFTAKHVVKPIAKTLFVRAAPTAGKFVLKKSAKYVLPFVAKLSVL